MNKLTEKLIHQYANQSALSQVVSIAKHLELRQKIAQSYFAAKDKDKESNFEKDMVESLNYLNDDIQSGLGSFKLEY